jgi:putative Mn2+ efflux pump MntP
MLLSIATSIDALGVGFSLAMIDVAIWPPSIVIGIVTSILSLLGILMGEKIGEVFGRRIEVAGGFLLVLIGIRILYSHMIAGAANNGYGL